MTTGTRDKKRAVRYGLKKLFMTTVGAVLYAVSIGLFWIPTIFPPAA
ncbi:MAG: hypothetical protein IKK06_06225 [Clostridia bacterium]|nr:hypothetical protein [Clostridia bacterium]